MDATNALRIWLAIRSLLNALCLFKYPEEPKRTSDDELKMSLLRQAPKSVVLAIDECFAFKEAWSSSPDNPACVDYFELGQAIATLLAWFEKLGTLNETITSHAGVVIEYCKTRQELDECKKMLMEMQLSEDSAEFMDDEEEEGDGTSSTTTSTTSTFRTPVDQCRTKPTVASVSETKSFESYKVTHKEKLKGARIRIADGKHEGKECIFVSWNGSAVNVKMVGTTTKVSIPEKRHIVVLEWPR